MRDVISKYKYKLITKIKMAFFMIAKSAVVRAANHQTLIEQFYLPT